MFDELDPRDREDDRREPYVQWVQLGRGPSSGRGGDDAPERHEDARDRDREERDRHDDPRGVFAAHLDLPRGQERELVLDGHHRYEFNRDDGHVLAAIGAFRVVPERHLADGRDNSLPHLRDQGLVRSVSVTARDRALTLTERGRHLLETQRRERGDGRQQDF